MVVLLGNVEDDVLDGNRLAFTRREKDGRFACGAVPEDRDGRRDWRHAHGEHRIVDQSVQHCGLTALELANARDKEPTGAQPLVELGGLIGELRQVRIPRQRCEHFQIRVAFLDVRRQRTLPGLVRYAAVLASASRSACTSEIPTSARPSISRSIRAR